MFFVLCFFFSSRRRHTRLQGDWSSDVCSSDLGRLRRDGHPVSVRSGRGAAAIRGGELGGRTASRPRHFGGDQGVRSEERRVGKESRALWWADGEDSRVCSVSELQKADVFKTSL